MDFAPTGSIMLFHRAIEAVKFKKINIAVQVKNFPRCVVVSSEARVGLPPSNLEFFHVNICTF